MKSKSTNSSLPSQNLTSQYLNARIEATGGLTGTFWNQMCALLKSKLPVSEATDRIEDHIHEAFCKLIRRNVLRDRILEGRAISDRHLATFVLRSAYNDCRDEGVNPVARELYGARSQKERKMGVRIKDNPLGADPRVILFRSEQTEKPAYNVQGIKDIAESEDSPLTHKRVEDAIFTNQCWGEIEKILRAKKPSVWQKYLKFIQMRFEGARLSDIAEHEGVSDWQVSAIMADVKKTMQEAADEHLLDFIYS